MAVLEALALGSSVASAISSFSKGRAQKRLAEERARQKRLQQQEIQRRTDSEILLIKDQANGAVGEALARFAGSGIDVGSGATTQVRMESFENLGRVILNKQLESKFRIDQLSLEERWELKQGKALQTASVLDGFGSLLSAATKASNLGSSSSSGSSLKFGETFSDAGFDPSSVSNIG